MTFEIEHPDFIPGLPRVNQDVLKSLMNGEDVTFDIRMCQTGKSGEKECMDMGSLTAKELDMML